MGAISFKALVMPPSLLEDLVKEYDDEFKQNSRAVKLIGYGGGPLAQSTGDYLAKFISVISSIYGQTEIAMPQLLVPAPEDWRYFQFHPTHSGITLEPTGDDEDHHELVINRDSRQSWLQPVFENFPDLDHWRTKDLFQRHPTRSDLWLFKGRRDDVIVLSNAENFNPVATEGMMLGHPAVKGALVIGTGNFQCGLMIEPHIHGDNAMIIEEVWPLLEKTNEQSPGFAQIDRQLIMVSQPEKQFHRAGKGTVMRYATTLNYADEIENLYRAYQLRSTEDTVQLQDTKDPLSIGQFVREIIEERLAGQTSQDDEDLFNAGLDSLKTAQIANTLQASLQPYLKFYPKISSRLLYENPNIRELSRALHSLLNCKTSPTNGINRFKKGKRVQFMKSLVKKYTSNLPKPSQYRKLRQSGDKLNVILTGSTGSLGYYILDRLLKDSNIGKIYCLDRSADAQKRFQTKSKFNGVAGQGAAAKLKWMKVNLSELTFGLPRELFDILRKNVDIIIHNAWKVDFNHSLTSFITQVAGVHNLASFSIKSPRQPRLFFVSSISATENWSSTHSIPDIVPLDYNIASPMGYGESKYVSERILNDFASISSLRTDFMVLRVGQIAGPTEDSRGVWNKNEWFPSLLLSSRELRKLPRTLGKFEMIDWIPVDALADIVLDLVHDSGHWAPGFEVAEKAGAKVVNLVNPKRVSFRSLVEGTRTRLGADVETVEYDEWLQALKEHAPSGEKGIERFLL